MRARLEYDLRGEHWVAIIALCGGGEREYRGETPEEAVASARFDINKHDLWALLA